MRALLPLLLLAVALQASPPASLHLVSVLYRHGARTPIDPYATDPNTGAWPQGDGQLTNEGKQNQLELGRYLRQRYDGYLPQHYHRNHTLVRSTDVDRTLMSAQANLAGLYPPQGEDVWEAQLPWQPIPVHTVPVYQDLLLRSYDVCDAYVAEKDRVYASEEMQQLDAKYAGLYSYLANNSGDSIANVQDVSYLYDCLLIEWRANLTTPAWATAVPHGYSQPAFPDLLRPLSDLDFGLFGATELLRRLGGGPLLKEMLANMQAKVEDRLSPPSRRLFVYSGHDTDVACLTTTLGVYNNLSPPLASSVLVELHSDPTSGHVVQLWYRNDTSVPPYPLQVPGCELSCPWERFVNLTASVVPGDVGEECHVPDGEAQRKPRRRV